jgi:hypothetical protein
MATIGTTAVVILVPGAEQLISAARYVAPALVRPLPAHITVLYPFVPRAELDERILQQLAAAVAEHLPGDVNLREVVTVDGFVGIPVTELDATVAACRELWPMLVPYGGRYGVAPDSHLTAALGADDRQAESLRTALESLLPVRSPVTGPLLLEQTTEGWRPVTVGL